jgi:hypothetical protein
MPYRRNYPRSVAEVLDDRMTFRPAALRAVRAFARSKPWRGTFAERWDKFMALRQALSEAYGVAPILEFHGTEQPGAVGNGAYWPAFNKIVLVGRLSVVTFLHEFAHARGADERQAVRWSVNLFRRCFPRSFARCRQVGHLLVRP